MARRLRIAVIGAGIGGLAAACALRQRGLEVDVYERAPELGEVGAGLQLGPNAVKVLRALGIERALDRHAFEPTNIVSVSWDRADLRFREPLKAVATQSYGARYLTIHRADLHRMLQEQLPDRSITLGARCTGVAQRDGQAVATFDDGRAVEADVIVGADGINSEVRARLFGVQPARWTQQMAWRCMVPIERVPTRIGPGGSVAIGRDEYVGWIGPEGHVICYPICGGALYNVFAGHVSEDWVDESWSVPSSIDELIAGYAGWNEALLEMLSHHAMLQMGHPRPRSARRLDPRTDRAVGRCGASDDADARPGRRNHARGRVRAGPRARAPRRRSARRARGLRGRAPAARPRRATAGAPAVPEQPQAPRAAAAQPRLDFSIRRDARAGRGLSSRSRSSILGSHLRRIAWISGSRTGLRS
jgi:2-polyprenyl-6-methoxyphenol hydroxylase-like FAD-dependent oxidoreductase